MINVLGDLISCSVGYNFARYLSLSGYSTIPLIVYVLSEFLMALIIRDNFFLMGLQLMYPLDWIKKWQAEVIPYRTITNEDVGYWSTKYKHKYRKYVANDL